MGHPAVMAERVSILLDSVFIVVDPKNAPDSQTCNYSADDMGRIAGANCGSKQSQRPRGNL